MKEWRVYDTHRDGTFCMINPVGKILANVTAAEKLWLLKRGNSFRWRHCIPVRVYWSKLRELMDKTLVAHAWVTDESLQDAIDSDMFDDPIVPHDDTTHHAARIATMCRMIKEGVVFPPPVVYQAKKFLHMHGNHRVRAYQHLGIDEILVVVKGKRELQKLKDNDCIVQEVK